MSNNKFWYQINVLLCSFASLMWKKWCEVLVISFENADKTSYKNPIFDFYIP